MKNILFILFLVACDTFLLPAAAAACDTGHTEMEMPCCKAEHSQKQVADRQDPVNGHKTQKENRDCPDGGCASACHCPATGSSLTFIGLEPDGNTPPGNPTNNRPVYSTPGISSGFYTIWRPPKVSG